MLHSHLSQTKNIYSCAHSFSHQTLNSCFVKPNAIKHKQVTDQDFVALCLRTPRLTASKQPLKSIQFTQSLYSSTRAQASTHGKHTRAHASKDPTCRGLFSGGGLFGEGGALFLELPGRGRGTAGSVLGGAGWRGVVPVPLRRRDARRLRNWASLAEEVWRRCVPW